MFRLENDHNVYVLGAGVGFGAGLPIMRNFLVRMRDSLEWLSEEGRTGEREAVEAVLDFRLRGAAAAYRTALDLENVEELFSLASASGDERLRQQMQTAIAATLDFAARTSPEVSAQNHGVVLGPESPLRESLDPQRWTRFSAEFFNFRHDWECLKASNVETLIACLVGHFSTPSASRRNTFITFNYDTLVEEALARCGLSVDYCVERSSAVNRSPWINSTGVRVLKLHGSMNWTWSAQEQLVYLNAHYDHTSGSPFLIPPTWRKEFVPPLASVWNAAVDAIRTATRVVLIGFSMPETDQHFRYLLAAGLGENISLRHVAIVDPDVTTLQSRAAKVFRPELTTQGIVKFYSMMAFQLIDDANLRCLGRSLPQGASAR